MAAPNLLDRMTKLLAYVGDEGAQDGYPGATFRDVPLSDNQIRTLVNTIIELLNMPNDIKIKVTNLKNMFDEATDDEKRGLIEYLRDYEVNGMHGGRIRNTKKRRNNKKKTRRSRH